MDEFDGPFSAVVEFPTEEIIEAVIVSSGVPGPTGPPGAASTVPGPAGQGVPVGGTAGQALVKINSTNYNTQWASAFQPIDSDLTAISALTTTSFGRGFLPLADQAAAQAYVGATGGGSTMSYHTARVDPSGDDGTGTIGDMSKPFLTVQAAIDAAEAFPLIPLNLSIRIDFVSLSEDVVVTSLNALCFAGQSAARTIAFNSLTYAGTTTDFKVIGQTVTLGTVSAATTGTIQVELENASVGDIANTDGPVGAFSTAGTCTIENVTAAGDLEVDGGIVYGETLSAPGFAITIVNAHTIGKSFHSTDYYGAMTIDSAGSEVFVTDSVLQDVLAADILHLKDSRVIGTNNASYTLYEDVLLAGVSEPYDATDWDGNVTVPTKNDIRDKIESMGVGTAWGDITGTLSSQTDLQTALNAKQPIDSDLTTLAGLTATTNNMIVSVASSWASRTPAQVKTTLAIANTDVSGLGTLSTQSGTFSGTSSGTNTGDQTITLTGDVTGTGASSFATTLSSTAVTPGSYTLTNLTVDAKGRITAASSGSAGGTGTVTHTGGNLTSNAVVLGAGTDDTKVVAGIVTDGVNALTLGVAGTNRGSLVLTHSASSTITTLRAATASSASTAYEFPSTGSGGTETVATRSWVSGPAITNAVTGTGFWHTSGGSIDGAAIGETGSGNVVRDTSPTLVTPILGTPTSGNASNLTALNATQLTTGTVPTARLGSGTANSTTFLRGDQTYAAPPSGKVLQIVFASKTDTATTTSTSFVSVFSAAITPTSSSSKILVMVTGFAAGTVGGYNVRFRVTRAGTAMTMGDAAGSRTQTFTAITGVASYTTSPFAINDQDSPATTSSTTYQLEWCAESGGTGYLNRTVTDAATAPYPRGATTMILMEIQ